MSGKMLTLLGQGHKLSYPPFIALLEPTCKEGNTRFTTVPLTSLSDHL